METVQRSTEYSEDQGKLLEMLIYKQGFEGWIGVQKWKWKGWQREEHVQRPGSTNRRTSGPWRNLVTRSHIPSIAQKCKYAESLSYVRLFATPWTVGSSVHGIFQARVLELVAISSFRGSYWPRDWTRVSFISCIGRQFFHWQKCKNSHQLWQLLSPAPCFYLPGSLTTLGSDLLLLILTSRHLAPVTCDGYAFLISIF